MEEDKSTMPQRMEILRAIEPNYEINTRLLHVNNEFAIVKAEIKSPERGLIGTGHCIRHKDPELPNGFVGWAETIAISRAMYHAIRDPNAAGSISGDYEEYEEMKRRELAIVTKLYEEEGAESTARWIRDNGSEYSRRILKNKLDELISLDAQNDQAPA